MCMWYLAFVRMSRECVCIYWGSGVNLMEMCACACVHVLQELLVRHVEGVPDDDDAHCINC